MVPQKVLVYKHGRKEQFDCIVTLPKGMAQRLDWDQVYVQNATIERGKIVINFASRPSKGEREAPEMTYAEFRDKVRDILQYSDKGMTWTEIRSRLGLKQVVPDKGWVRRLEKDVGLERFRGSKGLVWRVSHL